MQLVRSKEMSEAQNRQAQQQNNDAIKLRLPNRVICATLLPPASRSMAGDGYCSASRASCNGHDDLLLSSIFRQWVKGLLIGLPIEALPTRLHRRCTVSRRRWRMKNFTCVAVQSRRASLADSKCISDLSLIPDASPKSGWLSVTFQERGQNPHR